MSNLSEVMTPGPGEVGSSFFEQRLAQEEGEASFEQPPQHEERQPYEPDPINGAQGDVAEGAGSDQSHLEGDQPEDDMDYQASEEEQPDPEASTGVNVNGKSYTANDIQKLEDSNLELRRTFNRKAAERATDIKQMEALKSDLDAEYALPLDRIAKRYNQLRNFDVSQIPPEKVPEWQQAVAAAQRDYHMIKQDREQRKARIDQELQRERDLQTATTLEILSQRDVRWADPEKRSEHYAKLREFALGSGDYSAEEFDDIGDHRIILGLQAQMDAAALPQHVVEKRVLRERKAPPQQNSQPRSADGRYTSAERRVMESQNARADGSLRDYFSQRLEREENAVPNR